MRKKAFYGLNMGPDQKIFQLVGNILYRDNNEVYLVKYLVPLFKFLFCLFGPPSYPCHNKGGIL